MDRDLEELMNWLGRVRDKLAHVDDVTGTDEQLIERLNVAKVTEYYLLIPA